MLCAVSCASSDERKTVDRAHYVRWSCRISRVEESVQAQVRERYAVLLGKQKDPHTPDADLGKEFGEMGQLLMAAEFAIRPKRRSSMPKRSTRARCAGPITSGYLYAGKGTS